MSQPIGSLKDLRDLLEGCGTNAYGLARHYPFYAVLLYSPANGLNEALHKYMVGGELGSGQEKRVFFGHFEYFRSLTGPNWLVAIVEDLCSGRDISEFKPAEVYDIARFLGVRVDAIPALAFFTEPKERKKTLVLSLRNILPDPKEITEEDLTLLFQRMAAVVDDCCAFTSGDARLQALGKAINKAWPRRSMWGLRASAAVNWSVANGKSVFDAISSAIRLVQPYLGS